jgi:two-component system response regulator LytT
MVDIKIICKKENYDTYAKLLTQAGFTISLDAELTFREDNFIQDTLIGKIDEVYEIIHYSKIVMIESFGHEIILHTLDKEYSIKEKLFEIEGLFEDKGFIRINKSQIINKTMIKEIRPSFNSKLSLLMKNKSMVDVTRNYLVRFKEFIGF